MIVPQYEVKLTEEDRKSAVANLFEPENEEERERAISEIQQWIKSNPDLKARDDRKMVLHFLRSCKFRPERTKCKITNFYKIRAKEDCWFKNRDPNDPTLMEFFKLGVFLPLHGHDKEGRKVIIIRTAVHDPCKQNVMDLFKVGKMLVELLIELDETISVYGVQAVLDLSGNTLAHTIQLTPSVVSKAVHTWQDCYPIRTRRMDFFSAPFYVNVVLKIFLNFMSEKLKSRCLKKLYADKNESKVETPTRLKWWLISLCFAQVHVLGSNQSDLHKIVDPTQLPPEYGGSGATLKELTDYWLSRVLEYREWFLADELSSTVSEE